MSVPVFALLALLFWLACTAAVLVVFAGSRRRPYPPEAAEAPDEPLEVQRAKDFTGEETGPAIVADDDLALADRREAAKVAAAFSLLVDESLKDIDTDATRLSAFYLTPEVSG